jgi:5'-nucleotidase
MKKERIAIDMDDVLADANGRFREYAQQHFTFDLADYLSNPNLSWEKSFPDHQPQIRSWIMSEGFFTGMQVIPDAQEVVARLHERYEIFIVSAAMEFPLSMKEKLEWMNRHFPFIDWRYIVFCGHKYMIRADYLIDDHERNLKDFKGIPLLFTATHNLHLHEYTRVNNWREVEAMLL